MDFIRGTPVVPEPDKISENKGVGDLVVDDVSSMSCVQTIFFLKCTPDTRSGRKRRVGTTSHTGI